MRIGFFADEYLPRLDGVITSMINSARGLAELGHAVFFIVPAYPGTKSEGKIIRVPSTPIPLSDNVRSMLPNRKIQKAIATLKLDIIHSHTPFAAAQLARKAAVDLALPHVTTFHTLLPVLLDYYPLRTRTYFPAIAAAISDILYAADLSQYRVPPADAGSRFKRQAWKWTGAFIDSVDHVISPSGHFAAKLEALGADTPISVVNNSLDLSVFGPRRYRPHRPLRLIAVGRLSPEKRQYELCRAVARLDPEGFELLLVGDGPDRKRLDSLRRDLSAKHIRLVGRVAPASVRRYLAQSDLGVLVSDGFDNQPMTILEYLASGLPVLYCDSELAEDLAPANSFLAPPDPAGLADTLSSIDPTRLPAMSRAAQRASRAYGVAINARKLEKIYRQLTRA